jgi:hypothetical protein
VFQASAFQVDAYQIGIIPAGGLPAVDIQGGKGGWDPYYYKKRNKRRDKERDVVRFIEEVEQAPLLQAPEAVQDQAREALEAARLALRLAELDALQKALHEINEFYILVRAEAKRLREIDDEDDEDLLLLS